MTASCLSVNNSTEARQIEPVEYTSNGYIISSPIRIAALEEMDDYASGGDGSPENPFIYENYKIVTDTEYAFEVLGIQKCFIIRNCLFIGATYGIKIELECNLYQYARVINNTIQDCEYGMYLTGDTIPGMFEVRDNSCDNASIYMEGTFSTLYNNTLLGCNLVTAGDTLTITHNTIVGAQKPVGIEYSGNGAVISYNKIIDCEKQGLSLRPLTSNAHVSFNIIRNCSFYGIHLLGVNQTSIHHNIFIGNGNETIAQAYEEASDVYWYEPATNEGNYYDDWSGTGSYAIDGVSTASDPYPLEEPWFGDTPGLGEFGSNNVYLFLGLGCLVVVIVWFTRRRRQ